MGEGRDGALSLSRREPLLASPPQHAPVYTLGKRGRPSDVRPGADPGIAVVAAPRGGQATWHGAGQVVLYPILRLRAFALGPRAYVESLEDAAVAVAGAAGVAARGRVPGRTGVWVGARKLAAVGVRVSGGVATHGLAYNVCPDLEAFRGIVPCGDEGADPTSLDAELAARGVPPTQRPTVDDVGRALVVALAVRLGGAGVAEADARDVAGGDSALLRALGVAE